MEIPSSRDAHAALPNPALSMAIAGFALTLDLSGCDAATQERLQARYADFAIPPQATPITIRLQVQPGPAFIPMQPGPWQIRTTLQNGLLDFTSYHETGQLDRATGEGWLTLRPQGDPENFLRVLYAWLCLEEGSLLLHACGVIRQGRGYVFFGPSGSGKTTVARLSLAHTVLSDDLVIVKRQGAGFRVYGVPFRGDMPEAPRTNTWAELRGVFALHKSPEHALTPMPTVQAVARLAACVPFVMTEAANAARVMAICRDLATAVPVRTLHFRRDDGFWRLIDGCQ